MSSYGDADSPVAGQPPQKRTRSAVACVRCKERRQKCDNAEPACGKCVKAGKQCVFTGSEYPSWYIKSLEDHIAKLESRLSSFESTHSEDHLHQRRAPAAAQRFQTPPPAQPNNLGSSLGFLSLLAAGEPYYVGMSGGYSIGHLVQGALYDPGRTVADPRSPEASSSNSAQSPLDLPGPDQRPFSCHVPRTDQLPASLPPPKLGHTLLCAYLSTVHRSYPFLDRARLVSDHLSSQKDPVSPITQRQKMTRLKLHLVYGIGARHLQLSSSMSLDFPKELPESHYVAAVALLGEAFELRGMDNVEALLLLALYSLHAPSGPGVWHLCGIALRLCAGMGIHRKVNGLPEEMKVQDQLRKRLFWSGYMLERRMSNILGRPYSLGDHDINVELPIDWKPTPTEQETSLNLPATDVAQHIHLVQLEQLLSQVQLINARITPTNPPSVLNLNTLRDQFTAWHEGTQATKPSEALSLCYYKAMRTALYPFVLQQQPDQNLVIECAKVSGQICQTYKRLHQGEDVGMSLLEVHDILVAGITLVYCAWLNPTAMNPFVVSVDLGACSTVLFLVSTRWKSARKFRDAFEAIASRTMDHIGKSGAGYGNGQWGNQPSQEKIAIPAEHLDAFSQGQWVGEDDLWRMISEMTGVQHTNTGVGMAGDCSWINDPSGGFTSDGYNQVF